MTEYLLFEFRRDVKITKSKLAYLALALIQDYVHVVRLDKSEIFIRLTPGAHFRMTCVLQELGFIEDDEMDDAIEKELSQFQTKSERRDAWRAIKFKRWHGTSEAEVYKRCPLCDQSPLGRNGLSPLQERQRDFLDALDGVIIEQTTQLEGKP